MAGAGPGHRPGGLTALAVLNFIFGGYGLLAVLGLLLLLGVFQDEFKRAAQESKDMPTEPVLYVLILLSLVQAALLIASGVGYLGQKRFLGKVLGNAYGLLGLGGTGISLAMHPDFNIFTIIGLIYPVLTLLLLNTTFKDDFPNP